MPKTGPTDASRRQSTGFFPMYPSPSATSAIGRSVAACAISKLEGIVVVTHPPPFTCETAATAGSPPCEDRTHRRPEVRRTTRRVPDGTHAPAGQPGTDPARDRPGYARAGGRARGPHEHPPRRGARGRFLLL